MSEILKGSIEDVFRCVTLEMETINKIIRDLPVFEIYIAHPKPDEALECHFPSVIHGALLAFCRGFESIFSVIAGYLKRNEAKRADGINTIALFSDPSEPENPAIIGPPLLNHISQYEAFYFFYTKGHHERYDWNGCIRLLRNIPETARLLCVQLQTFFKSALPPHQHFLVNVL